MIGTYTNAIDDDLPILTVESILEMRQQLKPVLRYRTSQYIPLTDQEGEPFCISLPEFELGLEGKAQALHEKRIVYVHPDNLPLLMNEAARRGYTLLEAPS